MNHHYFTSLTPTDHLQPIDVTLRGNDYHLVSAEGVFSAGRLDKATQVLLDKFQPTHTNPRHVADIGCGWGPISVTLASMFPTATLWASDVNERAIDITRKNVASIGHSAAHIGVDDDIRALAANKGVTFDVIASNPPIRIGKKSLHDLLLAWLQLLSPDGEMWIVVGKNLGADSLATWLDDQGYTVCKVASKKGFRVLVIGRQ